MSEEDGQLIAQYFGAGKEDVWRPSLVAFPRFQLYPSLVYKVPHSFRTTYMLTEAMQQLQDQSFFRTKCEETLQEPAYVAAVKGLQEHEALLNGHLYPSSPIPSRISIRTPSVRVAPAWSMAARPNERAEQDLAAKGDLLLRINSVHGKVLVVLRPPRRAPRLRVPRHPQVPRRGLRGDTATLLLASAPSACAGAVLGTSAGRGSACD
ncbi:unnamed protein product [Urochloa humidicola]